jgi:uncharacterized protein YgfB (UPF0149 family)
MNIEQMAEIKGYLSGFICSGAQSEGKSWLEVLEGGLHGMDISNQRDILIELYKQVSEDFLEEAGFTHTIFQKNLPLNVRAAVFRIWCHGFLAGIRQSGLRGRQLPQAPQDIREKIQYFKGISQLDMASIDITDADEVMFTEVTRFLEKTVLEIYRLLHQNASKH